jgi:large subunit ribosomal protein L22
MATVQPTTRVRAVAKDVHISPQKVRLVIDQVRGKRVNEALAILRFLPQGAAREVARVVRSASANAEHNNDMDPEDLVIALAYADEGMKLKRFTARSRGRPGPILKRFSHITIVVEERPRPVRGQRPAARGAGALRRGPSPTGRGRSQTPSISRGAAPLVPARAEAPGKI